MKLPTIVITSIICSDIWTIINAKELFHATSFVEVKDVVIYEKSASIIYIIDQPELSKFQIFVNESKLFQLIELHSKKSVNENGVPVVLLPSLVEIILKSQNKSRSLLNMYSSTDNFTGQNTNNDRMENITGVLEFSSFGKESFIKLADNIENSIDYLLRNYFAPVEKRPGFVETLLIYSDILNNFNLDIINILESCHNHHLPYGLLKKQTLEKDLQLLEKAVNLKKLQLAFSIDDADLFYNAKLTKCQKRLNKMEMVIKVPLKRADADYSIYKFSPRTFKSPYQTFCEWKPEPAIIVLNNKEKSIKTIFGHDLSSCNVEKHLCLIPQHLVQENSFSCARALSLGQTFEELIKICSIECESDTYSSSMPNITIHPISNEEFGLRNIAGFLKIEDTKSKKIADAKVINGSAIVTITCSHELQYEKIGENSVTLIPATSCEGQNPTARNKIEQFAGNESSASINTKYAVGTQVLENSGLFIGQYISLPAFTWLSILTFFILYT